MQYNCDGHYKLLVTWHRCSPWERTCIGQDSEAGRRPTSGAHTLGQLGAQAEPIRTCIQTVPPPYPGSVVFSSPLFSAQYIRYIILLIHTTICLYGSQASSCAVIINNQHPSILVTQHARLYLRGQDRDRECIRVYLITREREESLGQEQRHKIEYERDYK